MQHSQLLVSSLTQQKSYSAAHLRSVARNLFSGLAMDRFERTRIEQRLQQLRHFQFSEKYKN